MVFVEESGVYDNIMAYLDYNKIKYLVIMKYIKYFEENDINLDSSNNNIQKIFENDEWLVIKPKSFESLLYYSQDTEWNIENINSKYHTTSNFPVEKYKMNDKIYININKKDNSKYLFDFNKSNFYDSEENDIYLSQFFDDNKVLISVYGEIIDVYNVVKENDSYWIVIPDNDFFEKFFELDRNTRNDLIKTVLSGDIYDVFNYSYSDFNIESADIDLNQDNLDLLKSILILKKMNNEDEYDYSVEDIKDYDDIANIVSEYDIKDIEKALQQVICSSTESSEGDAAYNDILGEAYSFFGLIDGSAKWQSYKNNKYDYLWIKFKSNDDAYNAKLRLANYDDSYSDDKIRYSPPYYGYSADTDNFKNTFNEILSDKIWDQNFDDVSTDDIFDLQKHISDFRKMNPNTTEEQILSEIDIYINSKKYNL